MTKFFKFASLAVLAGAFVACSDELAETTTPEQNSNAFDANGNGYVKIAINLPTTNAGTRGIGDPGNNYGEFNDGDKNEYAVENAILALFDSGTETNTDEMTYTMVGAYDLSLGGWTIDDNETQITTHREIIRQINAGGATGNLYAYVVINKHNFFSLDKDVLTFNPNCLDPETYDHEPVKCNGLTLKQFSALTLRESGRRYDANSFMMTNMPYVNVSGGTINPSNQGKVVEVKTLYPLVGCIYPSEAEAQNPAKQAAEINVERVLAKVETTLAPGVLTTDHKGYKFDFLGWFIDNTNPNSYVGRHCIDVNQIETSANWYNYLSLKNAAANTYRMVSANPISATQQDRYRTFWAIDPNYNVRADVEGHDKLITRGGKIVNTTLMKYDASGTNIGGDLRASGSHYYCTENTFDVNHQSVSNTTRIVVVAQFLDNEGNPKSFYTLDREPDEMYDKDGIVNYTKARIADRASFMMWAQDYLKSTADATYYIKVSLSDPVAGVCTATMATIAVEDLKDADLNDTSVEGKGAAVIAFNKLVNATSTVDGETGHNEYLAGYHVNFFNQGISYYQALIQHFGDIETPWSKDAHAGMPNDVTHIYDNNDEANYLGRYGIVRNNWYKIDVTGIRQIGSPVVPPVPGKDPVPGEDPKDPDISDDIVENFLKIKVNIMPWAIRKQSVVL